MIQPSPALIVRADQSIEECVRLMKSHDVGSLLIVSDDESAKLIGIFTERDLLKKFDLIGSGDHWARPIRTVMSHPVSTLEASFVDQAGALMLEKGFRHIPVVVSRDSGEEIVVGMISVRDVLRDALNELKKRKSVANAPKSRSKRLELHLLSASSEFAELMTQLVHTMSQEYRLTPHPGFQAQKLLDKLKDAAAVVIDLDDLKHAELEALFKNGSILEKLRAVALCYNPAKTNPRLQDFLNSLKGKPSFGVFSKPVNVLGLFSFLEKI